MGSRFSMNFAARRMAACLLVLAPGAMAQFASPEWKQASSMTFTALCFVTPEKGYAGARGLAGGVYRTVDSGSSWTKLGPEASGGSHACHFTAADSGYIVLGHPVDDTTRNDEVLRTTDGGQTWFGPGVPGLWLGAVSDIHFPNFSTGYAAGSDGVFKTTNAGTSWFSVLTRAGPYFSRVVAADANVAFALTRSTVYRTTNGGAHWDSSLGIPGSGQWLELAFTSASTGYLAGVNQGTKLFKTVDSGATWTPLNPSGMAGVRTLQFPSADTGYIVAGGVGTPYKTLDAGQTWIPYSAQLGPFQAMSFPTGAIGYVSGTSLWKHVAGPAVTRVIAPAPAVASRGTMAQLRDGALEFRLDERTRVRVRLLDARGALLAEPLNTLRDSGPHRLALPAPPQGAAFHFLEFRADDAYQVIPLGTP